MQPLNSVNINKFVGHTAQRVCESVCDTPKKKRLYRPPNTPISNFDGVY